MWLGLAVNRGEIVTRKELEDGEPRNHVTAYNVAFAVVGLLASAASFVVGAADPKASHLPLVDWPDQLVARWSILAFAVVAAVLAILKSVHESRLRSWVEDRRTTLADELRAERIRIKTITNGALLGTARHLLDLAASPLKDRQAEISGFRRTIVAKACELVQSEQPRAAYFRVADHKATRREMRLEAQEARGRTDEFTSVFVEGSGKDENVWHLIDYSDDGNVVADVVTDAPAELDRDRDRVYKSYVSLPVRAGRVAFGMLTANSLETDGFTDEDAAVLRILARQLATAEVVAMSTQELNALRSASEMRRTSASQSDISITVTEGGGGDE